MRKLEEAILALSADCRRRAIGTKEIIDIELVKRDQSGDEPRYLRMTCQRAVFGPGQRQSRSQFKKEGRAYEDCEGGSSKNQKKRIHAFKR
jgi:hypothetical protein